MNKTNNKHLTENAQTLRKNMTKEERRLWYDFLKNLPVTINRQKVIGSYIADFYCASAKLIIELDGSQHYTSPQNIKKDADRDAFFCQLGITVLRYQNIDVTNNFEGVCNDIYRHIFKKGI